MVLGLLVALALNSQGPRHHALPGRRCSRPTCCPAWAWASSGSSSSTPAMVSWPGCCAALGQQSPQWINDPQLSLVMVIVVYIWKNLGYCAVVYLAGLQSLPQDVMEAAALDGAERLPAASIEHVPAAAITHHLLPADHHHAELAAGLRPDPDHDAAGQRHQHPDLRGVPAGLRRLQPGRLFSRHLAWCSSQSCWSSPSCQLRFVERKVHYS